MALAYWCEACGKVALDGDPYEPGCAKCIPPESAQERGWRIVVGWIGAIWGAWAVVGLAIWGLAWVLS